MQITQLSKESFADYQSALGALLQDAVNHGASLGFLEPLASHTASKYWQSIAAQVSSGETLLWIAQQDGEMLGTVQLALCMRENGANRAEVQKLMVATSARRKGVAAALMQNVEQMARQQRRGLLCLDTLAGSGAESFYQQLGYQRVGEIPDFAASPLHQQEEFGAWQATAIYYKKLALPAIGAMGD